MARSIACGSAAAIFSATEHRDHGRRHDLGSERQLVAAISNGGGFGVIASGSMSPALLAAEIEGTLALTDRPFGVNLITMHPQLTQLIEVCAALGIGHVVLAGGLPSARRSAGQAAAPRCCALRRPWRSPAS